jgi:hypothetical protein
MLRGGKSRAFAEIARNCFVSLRFEAGTEFKDHEDTVLRVPIEAGRFRIRQSQPQMKWHLRAVARPDVDCE